MNRRRPLLPFLCLVLGLAMLATSDSSCTAAFGAEPTVAPARDRSAIGLNIAFPDPYVPQWLVNDRMKTARFTWRNNQTQAWGSQEGTAGTFLVLYDGPAPTFSSTAFRSLKPLGPGRWELVTRQGDLEVRVADTSKLLQILVPGTEDRPTDVTDLLSRQLEQAGFVRPMDIMRPNDAQGVLTWENRPRETDQFWSDKRHGAPIEPWIRWCKKHGKILYLNVPHTATVDYVIGLAEACREAGIDVKLAYSNETWNDRTKAGGSMYRASGEPLPDGGVPALARAAGLSTSAFTLKRCIENGRMFRTIMPEGSVTVVFEVKANGGMWNATEAWNTIKPQPGDVDQVAIAPYMSDTGNPLTTRAQDHANFYVAKARSWVRGQGDTMRDIPLWAKWAADRALDLIDYEVNIDPTLKQSGLVLAAQKAAQLLPETGEALGLVLDAQFARGVKEAALFVNAGPDTSSNLYAIWTDPFNLDVPKGRAFFTRAAKHRIGVADPEEDPTTQPTTKPTTQPCPPTTKPTTQPAPRITFTEAIAKRNALITVDFKAEGVYVMIPLPSPIADAKFFFAARDAQLAN